MALRGRAANREGFILNSIDRAAFADERFLRVRKLRLRLARRKKQRNFARKLRTGHRCIVVPKILRNYKSVLD